MVEAKPGPPVRSLQQRLQGTGKVHNQVLDQEKPVPTESGEGGEAVMKTNDGVHVCVCVCVCVRA